MPHDKDDRGESIFLTPYQYRCKHEIYVDPDTGEEDPTRLDDGTYKPGRHPNSRKAQFGKGDDNPSHEGMDGTRKGCLNKKTIQQELTDQGGMTPAQFMAAVVNDPTVNLNQRLRAAEGAARYYDPALSSIELHTDDVNAPPFQIVLPNIKESEDLMKDINKGKEADTTDNTITTDKDDDDKE